MRIHAATKADIPLLAELGRAFHAHSHWAMAVPFNEVVFLSNVSAWMSSERFLVLVSRRGFIVVGIVPLYFSGESAAMDVVFYCEDGAGTALRDAAEAWALDCGVQPILMGCHEMDKAEAVSRWYQTAGYEPFGRSFLKVLN